MRTGSRRMQSDAAVAADSGEIGCDDMLLIET
jgi:hypothetical protein